MIAKLQHCLLADKHHKKLKRAYCHVGHKPSKAGVHVVCCAKAFWKLPAAYRKGLVHHEVGHLVRPDIIDELKVDKVALRWGVKVIRRSGRYGDNLEWAR